MSRIGKAPIAIPSGVNVTVADNIVTVKGPKGELKQNIHPEIQVNVADGQINVERPSDEKQFRAMHGLYRSLINNMVKGVSEGFKKEMELKGVGYKAAVQGKELVLNVGYSHEIRFAIPANITIATPTPTEVVVSGADKQTVGQVAADIRSFRPPEPYKGKGIRYKGEYIAMKEGKKK